MANFLFVTTISGFLPQFESGDAQCARQLGCKVFYASNFDNPVYVFDREELVKQGIELHQIPVRKSPLSIKDNLHAIKILKALIDREDIDIIHCHNPMGGVTARVAARFSKKHPYVIYTAHGFHFYKGAPFLNWLLYYSAEKFLARWTDHIVTINAEDYKRALRFNVRDEDGVTRIGGVGCDSDRFKPIPEIRLSKRKEIGIPENAFHIVTAAEINDNKNQKVIIEALARMDDKDVYYSICGKGPNEEYLRELIRKYELEDRVRLIGYRTDMEEILQTADVFAFPSIREGFGIAAVEALLCGVSLIASDTRGAHEYAKDGINSIVCKTGKAEEYAFAIRKLKSNPELLKRFSDNCRDSAFDFTDGEVRKIMRPVYERAIQHCSKKVK
ncbi:MAG: glycosyltransferase [Lachnospiraceae bacterium]|nr:glycosyltransferase [Lachnospiraceae bacterium]